MLKRDRKGPREADARELLAACGGMSRFRSTRLDRTDGQHCQNRGVHLSREKRKSLLRLFSSCSPYSFFVPSFSLCPSARRRSACPVHSPSKRFSLHFCFPPPRFRFGDSFLVVLAVSPRLPLSFSFSPPRPLLARTSRVLLFFARDASCSSAVFVSPHAGLTVHAVTLFPSTRAPQTP